MNIGFIGAGKVGTAFGLFLKDHGHKIVGYYSKTRQSAEKSCQLTASAVYDNLKALVEDSDLLLITTPDGIIEEVAKELASFSKMPCALGHMSGALTSEIFTNNHLEGSVFSLHPLQAFATIEQGRQDLKTCTFAIEGQHSGIEIAKALLSNCSNSVLTLEKEQKAMYHAAACVTSNYMMAVTALAEEMIATFDASNEVGLKAYKHLMIGAINNAIDYGSAKALTGPIARGDLSTVEAHLSAMSDKNMKKDYSTLGMMTVTLAEQDKLTDPVLKENFRTLFSLSK